MAGDKYKIEVLEKALIIIDYLSECDLPVRVADIAKYTSFKQNQVYRILQTLRSKNWVIQNDDFYVIGDAACDVWARYERRVIRETAENLKKLKKIKGIYDGTGDEHIF
jgi:DNA-binding IclR family transcriptional regulator